MLEPVHAQTVIPRLLLIELIPDAALLEVENELTVRSCYGPFVGAFYSGAPRIPYRKRAIRLSLDGLVYSPIKELLRFGV